MILMSVLYAARIARFDLFKPIQFLAKRITKWDKRCDLRLHQVMSYINSTMDFDAYGVIGDHPRDLTLHLYVDADFAGCPYSLRSTSGAHTCIQGPNSRYSWGAGSNQQTSRAQSTPEAELASMNEGMKRRGEQALIIWQWLLEQYHEEGWTASIVLHEDSTTAIIGARTAKNPTMKTLERGFGIDIGWNNSRILSGDYELIHTSTKHMIADIYTKAMCNAEDWNILRKLVGIFTEEEFNSGDYNPDVHRLATADQESDAAKCLKEQILNHHYRMAMSGESTKNSEFKKAVKVKPPKKKDPLKGKYQQRQRNLPNQIRKTRKRKRRPRPWQTKKMSTPGGDMTPRRIKRCKQ